MSQDKAGAEKSQDDSFQAMHAYYEIGLEESRLLNAEGALELVRTQEIIKRYIPPAPAVVLDIGGGPGRYAVWLARAGYEVHLVDLVPLHLEQANQASSQHAGTPIASVRLGDARRLDFSDKMADVVLLLGPLYHLIQRHDRLLALREARRVLKPDGLLVAIGISKYASTLAGLIDGYLGDDQFMDIARRDMRDGQHRNPTSKPHYFTTAFFHHPLELECEVQEAGFSIESILAVEGPATFLQDLEEQWQDPDRRQRILEVLRWLESEPAVLGVTGHMAVVAWNR